MQIGEVIKKYRLEKNISTREMADIMECEPGSLWKTETQSSDAIKLKTIIKAANALQVKTWELIKVWEEQL